MNFQINTPHKISLNEILARQDQERGLTPMPLETELLLKRVKDGGFSGEYLAAAFISAYRMSPFNFSLGELINLDAEGFRLFYQVQHIRHISGWSDSDLYAIELEIKSILKEAGQ